MGHSGARSRTCSRPAVAALGDIDGRLELGRLRLATLEALLEALPQVFAGHPSLVAWPPLHLDHLDLLRAVAVAACVALRLAQGSEPDRHEGSVCGTAWTRKASR